MLMDEQKQLNQGESGFTLDEMSFSEMFTEGFLKSQKQTQPKIDKWKNEKARLETENLKFIEKIGKEFKQHVKVIAAKDGLVVGDKE